MDKKTQKIQEIYKKLAEVEEIALAKIRENSLENINQENLERLSKSQLQALILKQQQEIENLNREIFSYKKTAKNLIKENEFLREKNEDFSEEVFQIKSSSTKIISLIEEDFNKLQNLVKQKIKQ